MKKVGLLLLICMIFSMFFISGISAQEINISEIDENAELEIGKGITPDSAFYFLDKFFDNFGDEVNLRQERVAEIKGMIEEENYEAALEALERYKEHAEEFEKEVSPEERDEARRSAAAIYNVLKALESQIPDEYKEDFDFVIESEKRIVTAAEIAGKIKSLCEELSEIDPLQYSKVCKTGEDAPKWQKNLDEDLTEKQREEAKKFGRIMSECFRTSGQECRCEEIPFPDFAETCSIAAPLAVQCDIEGNEDACEKLDNIEMPELPEHLQDVFDDLQGDISEAQFELHMPRECREAGATTPKECMRIMIQTHAPEECRDALIDADVQNEREAREICEDIMFERNAPEECIEEGITDPKECSRYMFQIYAPQECIDAGLTGEHRSDERECREIAGGFGEREGSRTSAVHCGRIENPDDRLACYDAALRGENFEYEFEGEFEDRFEETRQKERECAEMCYREGKGWSFSDGVCECFGGETDYAFDDGFDEDDVCLEEQMSQGLTYDEAKEVCFGTESFDEATEEDLKLACESEGGVWDGSTCVFDTETDETTTSSTEEDNTTTDS